MSSQEMKDNSVLFCSACGCKNVSGSAFCMACGAKLFVSPAAGTGTVDPRSEAPLVGSQNPVPPEEVSPVTIQPYGSVANVPPTAVQTYGPTMNVPPAANVPPYVRKPIPKMVFIIPGAVVAVLILMTAFFAVGYRATNPEGIANGYFKAVADSNYEDAFKYLDLDTTEFINHENFGKYLEKNGHIGSVMNYSITEVKLSESEKKLLRQMGFNEEAINDDESFSKKYVVTYAVSGVSSQESMTITLVKNSKKKLIFFDDYNVNIESLLVSDYKVSVPKGAEVSLGGVALKDQAVNDPGAKTGMETYNVPQIFAGSYALTVNHEFCEEYQTNVSVYAGGSGSQVSQLTLKESLRTELAQKTEETYKTMFQGAIDGKSFEELGLACTGDAGQVAKIKEVYEKLVKRVRINAEGVGLKSAVFTSFTDRSYQKYMYEGAAYTCVLQARFNYVEMVKSFLASSVEERSREAQTQNIRFEYVYEDGAWVLKGISLSYYF